VPVKSRPRATTFRKDRDNVKRQETPKGEDRASQAQEAQTPESAQEKVGLTPIKNETHFRRAPACDWNSNGGTFLPPFVVCGRMRRQTARLDTLALLDEREQSLPSSRRLYRGKLLFAAGLQNHDRT
jgi:hypothetical protein